MLKSPMDYFAAQDFSTKPADNASLDENEVLFMQKYMGLDDTAVPKHVSTGAEGAVHNGGAISVANAPAEPVKVDESEIPLLPLAQTPIADPEGKVAKPEVKEAKPVEAAFINAEAPLFDSIEPEDVTVVTVHEKAAQQTLVADTATLDKGAEKSPEQQPMQPLDTDLAKETPVSAPLHEATPVEAVHDAAADEEVAPFAGAVDARPHSQNANEGDQHEKAKTLHDKELALQNQEQIQLVGFYVAGQLYTVPIDLVNEVIRRLPTSRLPAAPSMFIKGVINLRECIIPLVKLHALLNVSKKKLENPRFTIVTGGEFSLGLLVDKIHTMYTARQEDIRWNIETSVGLDREYFVGLFLNEGQIIPIISVKQIGEKLLENMTLEM